MEKQKVREEEERERVVNEMAMLKAAEIEQEAVSVYFDGDVEKARRSDYPLYELKRVGFSSRQCEEIAAWRRGGVRLTEAAAYLGIPKGRMERWCKLGWIEPSFKRHTAILGAGTVMARYWVKKDLAKIKRRLPALERKDAAHRKALRQKKTP